MWAHGSRGGAGVSVSAVAGVQGAAVPRQASLPCASLVVPPPSSGTQFPRFATTPPRPAADGPFSARFTNFSLPLPVQNISDRAIREFANRLQPPSCTPSKHVCGMPCAGSKAGGQCVVRCLLWHAAHLAAALLYPKPSLGSACAVGVVNLSVDGTTIRCTKPPPEGDQGSGSGSGGAAGSGTDGGGATADDGGGGTAGWVWAVVGVVAALAVAAAIVAGLLWRRRARRRRRALDEQRQLGSRLPAIVLAVGEDNKSPGSSGVKSEQAGPGSPDGTTAHARGSGDFREGVSRARWEGAGRAVVPRQSRFAVLWWLWPLRRRRDLGALSCCACLVLHPFTTDLRRALPRSNAFSPPEWEWARACGWETRCACQALVFRRRLTATPCPLSPTPSRLRRMGVIDDLQLGGVLGRGSYGHVYKGE